MGSAERFPSNLTACSSGIPEPEVKPLYLTALVSPRTSLSFHLNPQTFSAKEVHSLTARFHPLPRRPCKRCARWLLRTERANNCRLRPSRPSPAPSQPSLSPRQPGGPEPRWFPTRELPSSSDPLCRPFSALLGVSRCENHSSTRELGPEGASALPVPRDNRVHVPRPCVRDSSCPRSPSLSQQP